MQTPNIRISRISEKWIKALSQPIVPVDATAIIYDLYQRIGYPLPKIVFVDSPWATSIAAELLLHQSSSALTSVRDNLLNLFDQIYTQMLRQYLELFDPSDSLMNVTGLAGALSDFASTKIYYHDVSENYFEYAAKADVWYGYRQTRLDDLTILATKFKHFGFRHRNCFQGAAWTDLISPLIAPLSYSAYLNKDWISELLHHLKYRLIQQLNVQIHELPLESEIYSFPPSKPIQCVAVTDAAFFELIASNGVQVDSELLALFLRTALHLGFINPFEEVCFVSDRPRFKRDAQNNLHAEGEPTVMFPDSFGMSYFYHGTELPQYLGIVHPSQWEPRWILQEQNAEVRRCLIQEIGYARMCQELQAKELDFWREYTLLKLPIDDDYSQVPPLPLWKRPEEVRGEAAYLLKMVCPSTGYIYAIRVPPSMRSAREAATWINWGSDPEWFVLET